MTAYILMKTLNIPHVINNRENANKNNTFFK